jgi:cyclohexanone monooxygenase
MAAAVQTPVVPTAAPAVPEPEPVQISLVDQLTSELAFNPEEIKKRYLAERDKRLRKDGNEQYKQFKGQFQHYLTDPYTPMVERDPVDIETDFMVLGGGFGGLCLAARLVEAGITDIKILDKGGDFGGTWYWNRYPGASCDIGKFSEMLFYKRRC